MSMTILVPAIVTSSNSLNCPDYLLAVWKTKTPNVITVRAAKIAGELGDRRVISTILLGVLSNHLSFGYDLRIETLKTKVKARFADVNLEALRRWREVLLRPVEAPN